MPFDQEIRKTYQGKNGRERVLLCLTDEDLSDVGEDPSKISDELFEWIAQELAEYLDEGWQHALMQSIESAKLNYTSAQQEE